MQKKTRQSNREIRVLHKAKIREEVKAVRIRELLPKAVLHKVAVKAADKEVRHLEETREAPQPNMITVVPLR